MSAAAPADDGTICGFALPGLGVLSVPLQHFVYGQHRPHFSSHCTPTDIALLRFPRYLLLE